MKTIVLIRHAKSSWDNAADADFDRPLNARGFANGADMAARLLKRLPGIDHFISSPARRATETATLFTGKFPASSIRYERQLYLAPASSLVASISTLPDQFSMVAIIAHNPGITDLANQLTQEIQTDNIPTCGIFAVQGDVNHWKAFERAAKHFLFFDYPKAPFSR
jgi:phosphohistidine phosphatase